MNKRLCERGCNTVKLTCARLTLVVLFFFVGAQVIANHCVVVSGHSMEPTYQDGDLLPVVKQPFTEEELPTNHPACWVETSNGDEVIKRLIGYPGDVVDLANGNTYVNGQLLMERAPNDYESAHYELGEDDYLFLGDNRLDSYDGRYWPGHYVDFSSIRGYIPKSGLD